MEEKIGLIIAKEVVEDTRTWVLEGSFHLDQGFYLFPEEECLIDVIIHEGREGICEKVSEDKVKELVESPYCENKETVRFLLDKIDKLRSAP